MSDEVFLTGAPAEAPAEAISPAAPAAPVLDELSPQTDFVDGEKQTEAQVNADADEDEDAPEDELDAYPYSTSPTLAIFAPGLSAGQRARLFGIAFGINFVLPFINGVALGFGEIAAQAYLVPWANRVLRLQGTSNDLTKGMKNMREEEPKEKKPKRFWFF